MDKDNKTSSKEETRMQLREYIMKNYLSCTIRRYYEQNGLELSDSLLAAVMYRLAPMDEMRDIFLKLSAVTPDRKLAKELKERCDYTDMAMGAVKSSEEGCVFRLEVYENDAETVTQNGIFTDFDAAKAVGQRTGHDFKITKVMIFESVGEALEAAASDGSMDDECGFIYYKQYETGLHVWTCVDYSKECDDAAINEVGRFELDYVGIRHPFRRGDMVRMKDGFVGIISEPADDGEMEHEIAKKAKTCTFQDEVLRVNYVYDSFRFGFKYCNIFELESATEDDVPEDQRIGLVSLRIAIVGRSHKPANERTIRWVD